MSTTPETEAPPEGGQEEASAPPPPEERGKEQEATPDMVLDKTAFLAAAKEAQGHVPLVDAQEEQRASAIAEKLTGAAEEARDAAAQLEAATEEAKEAEPSLLRSLAHGALWTGGAVLVGWCLNKLIDALFPPKEERPFLRREDEPHGAEPLPTAPPRGGRGAAGALLLLMVVLAMQGCATTNGNDACAKLRSAQAGYAWTATVVPPLLENARQNACMPTAPPPTQDAPAALNAPPAVDGQSGDKDASKACERWKAVQEVWGWTAALVPPLLDSAATKACTPPEPMPQPPLPTPPGGEVPTPPPAEPGAP